MQNNNIFSEAGGRSLRQFQARAFDPDRLVSTRQSCRCMSRATSLHRERPGFSFVPARNHLAFGWRRAAAVDRSELCSEARRV